VNYDPTLFRGAAAHYVNGRPAYSRQLVQALDGQLTGGLSGRLLDVGCGPGVLTLELAPSFEEAIGLDPDADMLAEGARRADAAGIDNIAWVRDVAENIGRLDLGLFRLATFGQSLHWTDRERVIESVFDVLEPGGAIALIAPVVEGRPVPPNPGHPLIPHDELRKLIAGYLGSNRRAGQGLGPVYPDRYEDVLPRTRFGEARHVFAPGRPDVVKDIDSVVDGYLARASSAPHLFGDRLEEFERDARSLLATHSPSGLFWDWPGDTDIVVANKPG
jgi:ubiquinone/menaquinone biosynthesis C-methylase UbiE